MAITYAEAQSSVARALTLQGYRRADGVLFDRSGNVVGSPQEPGLSEVARKVEVVEIGRQLGLLGQEPFGRHFLSLWVKTVRDPQVVEVIVVAGFGAPPLTLGWLRPHFDFVWRVMQSLERWIQGFTLSEAERSIVSAAAASVGADSSIASLLGTLSFSAGPSGVLIAVCMDGIAEDLRAELASHDLKEQQWGLGEQPSLRGYAWDVPRREFIPRTVNIGSDAFSHSQFAAELAYASR